MVLGAVYMLWMFQRVMFGKITNEANRLLTDLTKRETAILCTIVLFVFLMGLYPGLFLRKMDASAAGYLKFVQARNAAAVAPVPPKPFGARIREGRKPCSSKYPNWHSG